MEPLEKLEVTSKILTTKGRGLTQARPQQGLSPLLAEATLYGTRVLRLHELLPPLLWWCREAGMGMTRGEHSQGGVGQSTRFPPGSLHLWGPGKRLLEGVGEEQRSSLGPPHPKACAVGVS